MPTAQAIGALARGENAVIVGDPNQLPPTSFFSGAQNEEDDVQLEDLDSILDDCLALLMPDTHLLWHYRSKHESLITFSNKEYYNSYLTYVFLNIEFFWRFTYIDYQSKAWYIGAYRQPCRKIGVGNDSVSSFTSIVDRCKLR